MMRVCHLDTCPVGVATQNPVLRERFSGKPEFVVTFFEYIAQEVREILAELGFRTLDEAIGHAELIDVERAVGHWKAEGLDLTPILHVPAVDDATPRRHMVEQDHGLDGALDQRAHRAVRAGHRGRPAGSRASCRSATSTGRWARCSGPR